MLYTRGTRASAPSGSPPGLFRFRMAKADRSAWLFRFEHKLFDSLEYRLEFLIVPAFEFFQPFRQLAMSRQPRSHLDERPHDRDVNLDRAIAPKYAGEHRNALFGKRHRERTACVAFG